jgi:hypothetical protein
MRFGFRDDMEYDRQRQIFGGSYDSGGVVDPKDNTEEP